MQYREKNDDGIELHLDVKERELIWQALGIYSAYGKERYVLDDIPLICELRNVLDLPEFYRKF